MHKSKAYIYLQLVSTHCNKYILPLNSYDLEKTPTPYFENELLEMDRCLNLSQYNMSVQFI